MPHYELLYPVRRDGERHEPPATLELSAAEAAPLIVAGAVRAVREPPKQKGRDDKTGGAS